jgi:hypothetical protein
MKACAKETFTSAVRGRKSGAARGTGVQSHFSNAAYSRLPGVRGCAIMRTILI